MPHRLSVLIFFFFVTGFCFGQNSSRKFQSLLVQDSVVFISTQDGDYRFCFYSPEIIETTFLPKGKVYNPVSHAHGIIPLKKLSTKRKKNSIEVTAKNNPGIVLKVSVSPFRISYSYKGAEVLSESEGYVYREGNQEKESISFSLKSDEILMGGGARALGMNRRGHRLQLYNRAHYGYEYRSEWMNYTAPVVLSSGKYLLHFDNPQIGYLDLDSKKNNQLSYEVIGGQMTYQLVVADNWKEIISSYTSVLTGNQPLPPAWALGNFASRFGYHSQREVESVVKRYEKDSIPLDALILDLYWFGKDIKGTLGNFEFFSDSFPDPQAMISDLHRRKLNLVLITEPFVVTTSKRWNEAVEKKVLAKDSSGNPFTYEFYFGKTGLIDIYDEKPNEWFWNHYRKLIKMGVDGFWGDLGEPEVHPSALLHKSGRADEVHNIYGHDWAKMISEGYKKEFPGVRPFILMRSGYSGTQRYGIIPWSGDVNRTWGGLKPQPEISLQMGMQGIAYMHSDLGGFAGANDDPELYTRWLQYGVFQPIFRPHAQEEVASEPIYKDSSTKALAREAIRLRYRFFPYNFRLALENHKRGYPLMRPVFLYEDKNYNLSDVYLWGDDVLVAPVLEKGQSTQKVYFPEQAEWVNWYTGKKYRGGDTAVLNCTINYIPFFVKAGSVIPLSQPILRISDFSYENLEFHWFASKSVRSGCTTIPLVDSPEKEISFSYNKIKTGWELSIQSPPEFKLKVIHVVMHGLEEENYQVFCAGNPIDAKITRNGDVLRLEIPVNKGVMSVFQLRSR
jgi:oligosaccharide 4-alpha-D-glucosyltransferase